MVVSLTPVLPGELAGVQAVIESNSAYTERVTGLPPGPADAQTLLMMRPPDVAEEQKVVLGIRRENDLVGLVDLLRGYPEAEVAYVGLLLVRRDLQRQGIGRAAHEALLSFVRNWQEVHRMRLAVVRTNRAVETFWRSLGYSPVGPPVPYEFNRLATEAQRFERPLSRAAFEALDDVVGRISSQD